MKKKKAAGSEYYRKAGLTKSVVVRLPPKLYYKLAKRAERDERSIQITVRRLLEIQLGSAAEAVAEPDIAKTLSRL